MFAIRRALLSNPLKETVARAKHSLPDLPYDYNALEPIISADIMKLHHSKHHATYVNNLNTAEQKMKEAVANGDVKTQIALAPAIKFNGGGHINHSIFWCNLSPCGGQMDAALKNQIVSDFGSVDAMKAALSEASIGVPGSGWGWLGYCKKMKRLVVTTCMVQDPLEATTGLVPILGIDVWEHAYYLQYKNVRPDYVKAIFDIVNWEDCSARFQKATS